MWQKIVPHNEKLNSFRLRFESCARIHEPFVHGQLKLSHGFEEIEQEVGAQAQARIWFSSCSEKSYKEKGIQFMTTS